LHRKRGNEGMGEMPSPKKTKTKKKGKSLGLFCIVFVPDKMERERESRV
jgi:hypothetical protein